MWDIGVFMKYFKLVEFLCKCGRTNCDATPMKEEFLHHIDLLREGWGKPLIVTSGQRCKWHNAREGGAKYSQHLFGNAADVAVQKNDQVEFVRLARTLGFKGIGWGANFIHIDRRKTAAEWSY
jgi:zinc D-Ala-D-Ala carboxypeptidase